MFEDWVEEDGEWSMGGYSLSSACHPPLSIRIPRRYCCSEVHQPNTLPAIFLLPKRGSSGQYRSIHSDGSIVSLMTDPLRQAAALLTDCLLNGHKLSPVATAAALSRRIASGH